MTHAPAAAEDALASHAPLSFAAFVAYVAALMALNAMAIDITLPALPRIGGELGAAAANDRQTVITAYLAGFGIGQFLMGPLSDRFGRRPVLIWGLAGYVLGGTAAALSADFAWLLAARALQGFGSSAPRVVSVALVRDCYSGRRMARATSFAMMVFMAAPVIAPSIGQAILFAGPWRLIFWVLTAYGIAVLAYTALRLPETLPPERRRPIDPAGLAASAAIVLGSRQTVGYALASGVFFGALFGFINSSQQIFAELYGLGPWFPVVFGAVAIAVAASAFVNALLVERLGMRLLSHAAVIGFTALAGAMAAAAALGHPPFALFLSLMAAAMTLCGLVFANFNALAMAAMGGVAGVASSLIGGATTLTGAAIGFVVGRAYDGTVLPLALGFLFCGAATLAVIAVAERGRFFSRA